MAVNVTQVVCLEIASKDMKIKDESTDHLPTVFVCMFDGMNVTLANYIIFTPVQRTILIMAENVPKVVVTLPPYRNPFNKSLTWIGFGTEGNRNSICNEGGLKAFDDFVGLTDIYRASGMFEQPRTKGTIFTDTTARRYKYLDGN